MTVWKVDEDHLAALIYEINRLGQEMTKFDPEIYGIYFSSRLAEIVQSMLGIDNNSSGLPAPDPSGNRCDTDDCAAGFCAGAYSAIFNSTVFLDEDQLKETLTGIRQTRDGYYRQDAEMMPDGSFSVWEIEQDHIQELILEINRLGRQMAKLDGEPYGTYFSTGLPDIILDMLGLPGD